MGIVSELVMSKIAVNNSIIKSQHKAEGEVADLITQSVEDSKAFIEQQIAQSTGRGTSVNVVI